MNKSLMTLYATVTAWATAAPRREKGATATEYALIVAGIAVAIVTALFAFGSSLSGFWSGLAGKLSI